MAVCDVPGCLIRFVIVVVILIFLETVSLPTVTTASTPAALPPPSGKIPEPDWLLVETLSTFAVEACDGQSVRLRCPRGTTVGVRSALYESTSAAVCTNSTDTVAASGPSSTRLEDDDGSSMRSLASAAAATGVFGSGYVDAYPRRHLTSGDRNRGERLKSMGECIAVNSQEVVVSLCEAKAQCSVRVASRLFNRPTECPSVPGQASVYRLSVTYQCRPSDIRSRPVCPGQSITLSCPQSDLLVLPSAAYVPLTGGPCSVDGPSTTDISGSAQWPPQTTEYTPFRDCGPEGAGGPRVPRKDSDGNDGQVDDDETHQVYRWKSANCPALSAIEKCHGRQSCTVFAAWCRHHQKQTIVDDRGLGSASSSVAAAVPKMTALRVAYACVPPSILRTSIENVQWPGSTPMTSFIPTICAVKPPIDLAEGDYQSDAWTTSPATFQVLNDSDIIERRSIGQPVGLLVERFNGTHWYIDDDWTWTWAFITFNGEKALLYAFLGALIGLIFLLAVVAVRLRLLHARRGRESRAFRFATCPCSTSGAFQISSTRTAGATNEYDGVMAVDVSSARCLTLAGDRTIRSTEELDEEDRWRKRSRDDDRCAAAEQCGASCATLLKSRTLTSSSSTNRPILQLDDD